jgi:hypothetical protein
MPGARPGAEGRLRDVGTVIAEVRRVLRHTPRVPGSARKSRRRQILSSQPACGCVGAEALNGVSTARGVRLSTGLELAPGHGDRNALKRISITPRAPSAPQTTPVGIEMEAERGSSHFAAGEQ